MSPRTSFSVSAPASSGNLGPGFDVFALALELRNTVDVREGTGRVVVTGEGADTLPTDATNLVASAFERSAGTSLAAAGVDLHCANHIPLARGLGSSTAAAACGVVAGWEYAEQEWDEDELAEVLIELDGHPDNAAACAFGGVVLCHDRPTVLDEAGFLDIVPLGAADWLRLIALVPDHELATADSRAALPDSYERADVVRAIGSSALLAAGLVGGHLELLEDALQTDVIHEPHRAALVPELAETREALADSRALGTTLSGAGPTVLVWCDAAGVDQVEGTLAIEFPERTLHHLAVAADGVIVS